MANQDEVLVKFRADANEVLSEVNKIESSVKKMSNTVDASQKAINRSTQKTAYGFNGLGNSINQLSRELPAFTYSAQTGFLALSNNIPILADQITNLKTKNLELVASGQKAIPVWKSVASALFSFQTALSVGITLIVVYGKEIGELIQKMFNFNKELKSSAEISKALNEVNIAGTKNAVDEKVKVDLLFKSIKDTNLTRKEQLNAVEDLMSAYPEYFEGMTKEQVLVSDLSLKYDMLAESVLKKAKAQVAYEKIVENEKKLLELQADLLEAQEKANSPQARDKTRNVLSGSGLSVIGKESNPLFEQAQANLKQIRNEIEVIQKVNDKLSDTAGGLFTAPNKQKGSGTEKAVKELGPYETLLKEISELQIEILNDITTGAGIQEDDNRLLADKKRLLDLINEENEKMLFLMQDVQKLERKGLGTVEEKTIKLKDQTKQNKEIVNDENLKKKQQDSYYNSAIDLSNSLLEITNNLTQTEIDNQETIRDSKIKSLDDQLERGTINEKKYQSEKTKAEKKADQEIASLRLKQQEREKAVASFQAILKGGLATLQAFIELGPIAGALVGLSVAAEVAAIQSQPLPKFEKGGLIQGKSHRQGGVIIEAEGNEFIVNKLQTPKHMDVLEHINKGSFEEYNKRRYIIPALKKERENIRQSIINSFNDANLLSSDQKNREILREIRDALKEGRPYTNKRKI